MSEYIVTINNEKKSVIFSDNSEIKVDGKSYHYEISELGINNFVLKLDNKFYVISGDKKDQDNFSVFVNGEVIDAIVRTGLQERASTLIEQSSDLKHKMEVKAPMPGMILKIKKNIMEKVEKGESIIILEAMKMENDIKSPFHGVIKEIRVTENNPVEKGAVLFTME
jgi:biotin carboxyl carrier protein